VVQEFVLEAHHLRLLQAACEAWDLTQRARETLAREGATFRDKHGQPRAHPGAAIARDNRVLFARLLKELGLDGEEPTPIPGLRNHHRRTP
jgi:P27 family predicted phage terminase small subunit